MRRADAEHLIVHVASHTATVRVTPTSGKPRPVSGEVLELLRPAYLIMLTEYGVILGGMTRRTMPVADIVHPQDAIPVDGETFQVELRELPVSQPSLNNSFTQKLRIRKLSVMDFLSLAEAAERIGVSHAKCGTSPRPGTSCWSPAALSTPTRWSVFLQNRGLVARRVWSEGTAWAAIGLLAGIDVSRPGASQVSRLRKQLTGIDAAELASRVRNRATAHRFDGHRSVVSRIAAELVRGSGSIGDLTAKHGVDGYLDEDDLADLVHRFHLTKPTSIGSITVRGTQHLYKAQEIADKDADLLTAVDLSTSADARERAGSTDRDPQTCRFAVASPTTSPITSNHHQHFPHNRWNFTQRPASRSLQIVRHACYEGT